LLPSSCSSRASWNRRCLVRLVSHLSSVDLSGLCQAVIIGARMRGATGHQPAI